MSQGLSQSQRTPVEVGSLGAGGGLCAGKHSTRRANKQVGRPTRRKGLTAVHDCLHYGTGEESRKAS